MGRINIEFSEDVTGDIALQNEDGEDVGWLGKVDGNKATLEIVKGKEIGDGRIYIITGKVSDPEGNVLNFAITFATTHHD